MSIFTVFLKNKNIIFKIRRSKVTDYAALRQVLLYLIIYLHVLLPQVEHSAKGGNSAIG